MGGQLEVDNVTAANKIGFPLTHLTVKVSGPLASQGYLQVRKGIVANDEPPPGSAVSRRGNLWSDSQKIPILIGLKSHRLVRVVHPLLRHLSVLYRGGQARVSLVASLRGRNRIVLIGKSARQ